MRNLENKRGFTLVELALSVTFIAILSITIALIIGNAVNTYRRGIVLNQVNTVGMDLVDDMQATVQNSSAVLAECSVYDESPVEKNNCESGDAQGLVAVTKTDDIRVGNENLANVPMYGAFCTGAYSYVWNSGYFFAGNVKNIDVEKAVFENELGRVEDFRLLKVQDLKREICKDSGVYSAVGLKNEFGTTNNEEPEILLSSDNANMLALYNLVVAHPAVNSSKNTAFYSVEFILGTVQGGINVMSSGNFCTAPEGYNSNFNYCAINKFNFAAQANGG